MTRFSVALPQFDDGGGAAEIVQEAQHAAALGFSGLWTLDAVDSPLARVPLLDGLHTLSVAAAANTDLPLGIGVLILPRRNPVLIAEELATIDRLSGGRLIVGVGLGRAPDKLTTESGLPDDRRVRRFCEGVEAMRTLWAEPDASYAGEVVAFANLTCEPAPMQRPGPPVWFGAKSVPALRRTARLADGWIGAGMASSAEFVEQSQQLDEELADAQRSIPKAKRVYIAVEQDRETAYRRLAAVLDSMYGMPGITDRSGTYGSVEDCAEQVLELVHAGADELILHPLYDHARQLEALAEVVDAAVAAD